MDEWAGINAEDEATANKGRGRFGRAQIFKVGHDCIAVPQYTHYMFRGEQLALMNYYEWCAIIKIVPKENGASTTGPAGQSHQTGNAAGWRDFSCSSRGRKKNAVYEFAEGHPLCGHYVQRIRSKLLCPILAGGPPPVYPNPPTGVPSARWRKKAETFARYNLTLFKPWDIHTGLAWNGNLSAWDAFGDFINEIDPHPDSGRIPSFVDVCRFRTICNVASALRVNVKRKKLLTMYRCRDARVWKDSTPDYACEFEALVHGSSGGTKGRTSRSSV
jgi:hypothetical protein